MQQISKSLLLIKKILIIGYSGQISSEQTLELPGNITQIYHLAAILSGNAEKRPLPSFEINMRSLMNVVELAREMKYIKKPVFTKFK